MRLRNGGLVLALLATPGLGEASEVGVEKRFGLGATVGAPVAFTGKYFFTRESGVSFHVGGGFGLNSSGLGAGALHLRVQYEEEFVELANWEWARLNLYWAAGGVANLGTGGSDFLTIGATGGIGSDMQFHNVPASVFVGFSVQIYPFGRVNDSYLFTAGVTSVLGGRWYF